MQLDVAYLRPEVASIPRCMDGLMEVLAPVGTVDSLKAALSAGADAVYLGGKRFGARHFAPNFSDEELARLTMPVLLMTGSADAVRNSPRMVERMLRLVPHATCRNYPGMGHLLLDFADDVVPFLESAEA